MFRADARASRRPRPLRRTASRGSPRMYAVAHASTNTPKASSSGPESLESAPTTDAVSPPMSAARHDGEPRQRGVDALAVAHARRRRRARATSVMNGIAPVLRTLKASV